MRASVPAEGYKGLMPVVAQEALTALEAGQPLVGIDGFGGCARCRTRPTSILTGQDKSQKFDGTWLKIAKSPLTVRTCQHPLPETTGAPGSQQRLCHA